jgi:hypothetical protein
MGLPDDPQHRQALLIDLVSGAAAHLSLCPGIELRRLHAGARVGLALHINREALQARQLQTLLERRFEQAAIFDGCFVFLDAAGAVVIWHAATLEGNTLDETLNRILSLAKLDVLDRHANW